MRLILKILPLGIIYQDFKNGGSKPPPYEAMRPRALQPFTERLQFAFRQTALFESLSFLNK